MTKREFLRGPSSRDSKSMRKKLLAIGGPIVMSWPFSRVDVYIGPDTKIERTVVDNGFLARVAFE